ncbi:PAS/PAC sensor signal transduction histidine kinase [Caldanaerovirga acetigignens]|uniref:histidine kinase n=1 Tax=Caldanaerovirga acetigignens TaxID=447595 RepID=A0A1M7GLV3_9FIRM|nr:ATP-binding protein [Caldanaerovirga acetigignens]SHM17145.1 PAS/PAC sensor signal transduction histidine kinase [Caldanaerovirga acetigignens]
MFKSIQAKLVTIYILLILLAMEVVGFYLMQSLERYHDRKLTESLIVNAQLISDFLLVRYLPPERKLSVNDSTIQEYIKQVAPSSIKYIAVMDEKGTVVASTDETRFSRGTRILSPEVMQATFGKQAEDIRQDPNTKKRYKYLAYPIKNDGAVVGILYLVASLEDIYETLNNIRLILLTATLLALLITGFLGYALSNTITGPIREVTKRAALLAEGNFDQKIEVKSDDEIGKLTDMFNFLTSRLKATLEEISEEKEKMEAILTNMADGVIALNGRGEVIHINPAAMRMLGLEGERLEGALEDKLKDILKINPEDYQKATRAPLEVLVKVKDGALKAIFAPLTGETRETGYILLLQDVTKQQRLEEMRKEFVANVSHELRTPLTTIKSYAETLLDGAMDDTSVARQFISVINDEADRMTRLVNDLLELSRLDNKEIKWNKRPVRIDLLLRDVISKMMMNAMKKKLSMKHEIEEGLEAFADRDKIEQVFQNILSNAIKYTPEGGEIFVKAGNAGNQIYISVKDTGIGIPKEDLPRIFERFYRVDKTRSRELGGTGLGLSIAREIVLAHDGEINIISEQGKGTEVIIRLPTLV